MTSLCKFEFASVALAISLLLPMNAAGQSIRRQLSLDGKWRLTANGATREVDVPGTFERQIAAGFDGLGTYEREIPRQPISGHQRLLVEFDGAATQATVWFGDVEIGRHLGAWTPFSFDVTDLARPAAGETWRIRVEVDEQVGHNTQGFLPVIQPHFGGLWQSVRLRRVPDVWLDRNQIMAIGNRSTGCLQLRVPVSSHLPLDNLLLEIEMQSAPQTGPWRDPGQAAASPWVTLGQFRLGKTAEIFDSVRNVGAQWRSGVFSAQLPTKFSTEQSWSPDRPQRFAVRMRLSSSDCSDQLTIPVAFRAIQTRGDQWLLNDRPLMIRGLLNWGYAPPKTSPSLDETWMRNEINLARSYGFNLMKFCLWVPPRRYLELCDELGMLAWIEYPTWHPQMTQQHLAQLRREYTEFFALDRNHPSVVLRSLTCETGSGAELSVIRSLYDLCKQHVPGAIVEDDSSWIEWNRISDFYDDHPYGNNHTWPATLQRLNKFIAEHGIKPLVLGEAIAADTWTSPREFATWSQTAARYHQPRFLADNHRWLEQTGLDDNELDAASRHYAWLMRKYQIETYRRLVPRGGYVVSVIRDFPLAGMGLVDYAGQAKWESGQWSYHGPTMLVLATENERRSFSSDEPLRIPVAISHFGSEDIDDGTLSVRWSVCPDGRTSMEPGHHTFDRIAIASGQRSDLFVAQFDALNATEPTRVCVHADLKSSGSQVSNRWSLWVFPRPTAQVPLAIHPSIKEATSALRFGKQVHWDDRHSAAVICASRLDDDLLGLVSQGARLLLLPDGRRLSFPVEEHWFLRGGPAIFPAASSVLGAGRPGPIPDALIELQHFDLAGPIVPQVDSMLDDMTPVVMLWDNHDRSQTRTHGLMFEIPVGHGVILVSVLDYQRATNAAGQYLHEQAVKYLADYESDANDSRCAANHRRLVAEIHRSEIELQGRDWRFQPDPEGDGESQGWHAVKFNDENWKTIKADRHWERQGYPSLDGWAWYRLRVVLDANWSQAERVYLNFTGVDDHYRLFINGRFVGSGGDLARKKTAFDERKSYDVSKSVRGNATIEIAVAVFDWYGAGGIFRPVTLSTQLLSEDHAWLK